MTDQLLQKVILNYQYLIVHIAHFGSNCHPQNAASSHLYRYQDGGKMGVSLKKRLQPNKAEGALKFAFRQITHESAM